jgi:hypothetical protein
MLRMFPKDDSLAATMIDDTKSVAGDGSDNSGRYPLGCYAHQGRLVITQLDKPRWLGSKSHWVGTEAFYWTEPNNLGQLSVDFDSDYFKVVVAAGAEAYGYTAAIPTSASELLMLRPRDGAVLLQGSLDEPNPIVLPYLKGTGINFNVALSAKGLVYTSQGAGMWLWQGGDVSEYASPGMDPNFWMVRRRLIAQGDDDTEIEWDNWMGQADSWGDWTLFSNNWVWDSETGSFWRICAPEEAEILRWSVDYQQMRAYGTPTGFRHGGDPICYEFHRTIPRDDYIWESHPVAGSFDRMKEVRQVVLTTTGEGRVKVRVFSAQDKRGQELIFNTSGLAEPAVQRQNCGVKGSHIQFEIISEADVTTLEAGKGAPQVHDLAWGWRDSAHYSANPQ